MNEKELLEHIQRLGLTNEEFAEYLEISIDTLKTWLYRNKEVPKRKVEFVLNKIKLHNNYTYDIGVIKEEPSLYNKSYPLIVNVPYYDVDFAGGWSSENLFVEQKPSFFINAPEFDKADFACNLFGNSISNRIANRSIIGLREITDWQIYFPTNELYAVIMKNQLRTVKVVKRSKTKEGFLDLIPDPRPEHNLTGYEIEEVPISFVSKFFQVVAHACYERIAM